MIKSILKLILFIFLLILNFHSSKAAINEPLQSRINQSISLKIFPQAKYLGAPIGDPPYIPVFGIEDKKSFDVNVLYNWRKDFILLNAREPTKEEEEAKIDSLQTKGAVKEIGYLFSTYETIKAKGYSGDYFDIIVGLKKDGRLAGSVIVELHEPMICPTCVPQSLLEALHDSFQGTNVNRKVKLKAGDWGGQVYDGVTGATISASLTTNGIITAARKVLRQTGLTSNEGPLYIDLDIYIKRNWTELINWGGIVGITLTQLEVIEKLKSINKNYIKNSDEKFLSVYAGLVSPASVGRNIFEDKWYSHHISQIETGDNLLVIMSSGWSWKKNSYLDSSQQIGDKNNYSRIQIVQNDNIYKFNAKDFLNSTALKIDRKPDFSEIGLLRIPKEWGFNPLDSWKLELIIKEDFGKGSVFINYDIPKQLITGDPVALEDAGLRPIKTAFLGLIRESKLNGWQSEWAQQDYSIIFLFFLLSILSLILSFQKKFSKNKKVHNYVRFSFLTITLIWIGWIAQAQLSIVNIISYAQAILEHKGYSQFLFEPLICIIFFYTVVSLILLGRGVFCGWLCPFGALQEITFKVGRLIKLPLLNIPFWLNERLWVIKYIILTILIGTIIIGHDFSYKLIEIEPFKTSITSYFDRSLPYVLYAGIIIVIGLFSERFFCRFICPLGAVLSFLGRLHIFNMIPRRPECGSPCHLCEKSCPVQAIAPSGKINMNECFQCLDCEVDYYDDKTCPPLIFKKNQQ